MPSGSPDFSNLVRSPEGLSMKRFAGLGKRSRPINLPIESTAIFAGVPVNPTFLDAPTLTEIVASIRISSGATALGDAALAVCLPAGIEP
jgi:hypothetical protein